MSDKPKIVCICGSTQLIEQIAILGWELEKEGKIALGMHLLPAGYFEERGESVIPHHLAEAEGVCMHMDELHLRKIDLADEVLIVNIGGYIGTSTRNEIDYAEKIGKPVTYLEPLR